MFNKSMNFIRNLIGENFYFPNKRFQICWLISGMEVMKNIKLRINLSKIMFARPKTPGTSGVIMGQLVSCQTILCKVSIR